MPTAKRPLLGSPGEKHRDRQLVFQLPKQDLALAYCRHVEQQHTASYEDFIHARNEIALDIGYVQDHASQDLVRAAEAAVSRWREGLRGCKDSSCRGMNSQNLLTRLLHP